MNRCQGRHYLLLVLSLVWGASASLASAEARPTPRNVPAQVQPYHVFARVALLRDDLEHLRFYMGKPKDERPELEIRNAAPREVFFQAMTLFKKANRLAFEITAETAVEPTLPDVPIHPSHVLTVVNAARERLRHIQKHLGMVVSSIEPSPDESKTPTDVFRAIVQANRQLNILLSQKFSPSDVYQQVSRAISYTFRLRGHIAPAPMPETPAFEAGKRPADVYRKLLGCFQRIRRIAEASHIEMLELTVRDDDIDTAEPSDVYDIASLIVSDLAHLHAQLKDARPPYKVYPPGLKFPAHVYQRARLLDTQLMELQTLVQRNPTWLLSKAVKR